MQLLPLLAVLDTAISCFDGESEASNTAQSAFADVLDKTSAFHKARQSAGTVLRKTQPRAEVLRQAKNSFSGEIELSITKSASSDKITDKDGGATKAARKILAGVLSKAKGEVEDGGNASFHGLKMTAHDLAELKDSLKEYGFSDKDIDALAEEIESESGLTWGGFANLLAEKAGDLAKAGSAIELNPDEKATLAHFFNKIGFTAGESEKLVADLETGNTVSVWAKAAEKIAALSETKTVKLTSGETAILSKVLRLGEDESARFQSLLSGNDSATLGKDGLKALSTMFRQTASAQALADADKAAELKDAVRQVFDRARGRADDGGHTGDKAESRSEARRKLILSDHNRREKEAEQTSDSGGRAKTGTDDETEGSKGLRNEAPRSQAENAKPQKAGPDTARHHSENTGDNGDNGDKAAKAQAAHGRIPKDGADSKDSDARNETGASKQAKAAREAANRLRGQEHGGDGRGESQAGDKNQAADAKTGGDDSKTDSARDELLSRIKFENQPSGKAEDAAASALKEAVAGQPGGEVRQDAAERAMAQADKGLQGRVMRQVQDGVFKNLGQGRNQLTLRLDPPELGALKLVLQVRENQVKAVIRAESADATRIISENLSQLRTALENQGLKVGKLEVQTQLQDDTTNQSWLGADGHNQAKEQSNRSDIQNRLKLLRGSGQGLAREMQNEAGNEVERVNLSPNQGLDLFA